MASEGYLVLQRTRVWSQRLRNKGLTWDQIAEVIALTHDVSPLRLYRLAHGHTAADVVALVNDADPAGTAALRESRLYDFESHAGRRPPARLLATLAMVYQTTARNLVPSARLASYGAADHEVIDRADFRHADTNRTAAPSRVTMDESAAVPSADTSLLDAAACVRLLLATGAEEAGVKRRELLFELALVFGGSQALGLLRILTPDEEERLAGVLRDTWRMDEATVRTFEKLTLQARRADDVSGPATLLPVVNGQRAAVGKLLAPLHETLSSLAHASEGDTAASARAHDKALASASAPKDNEPAFLYWVSPSEAELRRSTSLVQQNQPRPVIAAAERYLTRPDPRLKGRHAWVLTQYARALTMTKEIPEAAARLTEAADITRQHSSARLAKEINQARTRMEPWATTTYVRQLDETLRSCGLTSAGPGAKV